MSDREIMIARRTGAVHDEQGQRIMIRAGRTIADADHPIVAKYPRAWVPVNVALRTDGSGTPVAEPSPAEADPELVELAEQFKRLASALRSLDALPDQPLTAAEVVEHVVAIADEWQRLQPGEPPAPTAEREIRRAWARENGFEVADVGRLPKAVDEAYEAAHPVEA